MEFLFVGILIIVLVVVGTLYQRRQERNLVERIKQSRNNPNVAMGELDIEIQRNRQNAESWKRQSGKGL